MYIHVQFLVYIIVSAADRWRHIANWTSNKVADGQRTGKGQSILKDNLRVKFRVKGWQTEVDVLICKQFFAMSEIEDDDKASLLSKMMMLFLKASWVGIFQSGVQASRDNVCI